MKERFVRTKRVLAMVLAICILIMSVPFVAGADVVPLNYEAITDPSTVNDWKLFFGPTVADTTSSGGVWTDKSVFASVNDLTAATDETENAQALADLVELEDESFLVALSAIAASKSVEGYSTLPTDTMLVLDLSASMVTNQAVDATVKATNDALKKLLELNAYNRVGVIAYSGSNSTGSYATADTAEVILPMGRYTPGQNSQRESAYLVSSWQSGNQNRTGVKVAPGVTGTVADDIESTFSVDNNKRAEGGTYIQNGLYQAWEQFEAVAETTITEGLQAGVGRVPVMVLLSDGAPTTATTDYTNIGTANSGNGSSTYATPGIAFMTQLTASWVSDKLEEKYGTNPLFYTLGLNVSESDAAQSVLNPVGNTATDDMWEDYIALKDKADQEMSVEIRPGYWEDGDHWDDEWVEPITRTITYTDAVLADGWAEDYVTEYFPASDAAGLTAAFEDIVEQIVLQSLYYPTLVETGNDINQDGFLEFEDYIGKNMEVKDVKGIQLGEKLYTGRTLAKMIYEGGMGTQENPTDAGNNLVWSVQARLGIDTVEQARALLGDAYANGQLFYNPETDEYSNYIGWYADVTGKFVGFWDGKDASPAAVPAEFADTAVYAIKSYGYYDAIGDDDSHRKTDMMYATIQVRTTLKDDVAGKTDASEVGDIRVIGRLPASLIPLIEYNIDLNGMDPMDPATMTIGGATAPSRLIYEVGLSSKIDLLDMENTAPDDALQTEDGKYVFYTNQWHTNSNYSYSTNKNTTSYFEPSVENERYYYNADTPIYTDTNGTLYTGDATPVYNANDLYYHRFIVYTGSGENVEASYHYEPVSQYVLEHEDTDMARLADGSWVVLRGTIYHHYGDYVMEKTANSTGTLTVSDMPFVHEPEQGVQPTKNQFHVDSYLGNNGKLLVDPYEGIKITKTADSTIEDRTLEYTFRIDVNDTAFNETVTLIVENAEGERALTAVAFVNGVADITLKTGEAAYAVGNSLIGKTVTVSEVIPANADYEVASVNGDANATAATFTVASGVINTAAFINTKPQDGDVVITKTVVSTIDTHLTKEFEFTVTLTGAAAGDTFGATRSDGQTYTLTAGQNNVITLAHGQALHIEDLPAGVTVTAVETDYSNVGFTANALTGTATAVIGEIHYIRFTNTYEAKSTVPPTNVTITGTKNLVADAPWVTPLQFDFQLQRYDATAQAYVDVDGGTVAVTYNNETGEKTLNLLTAMQNETFAAAGTYSYRLVEIVNNTYVEGGIVYDSTPAYFEVVVSDDGLGQLYVSNVLAVTDTEVTSSTNGGVTSWNVDASFENRYEVNGAVEVVVNMDKSIAPTNGVSIPPSGFQFGLYSADADFNADQLLETTPVTGSDGKTELTRFYNSTDDIGTKYYVIKEIVPADADARIGYSQQTYGLEVIVGHVSGGYTVTVNVYEVTDTGTTLLDTVADTEGTVVLAEISGLITFENKFTAAEVPLVLSGTKSLTGKTMAENLFTFELVENGTVIREAVNDENGDFTFPSISYKAPGTYTYTLREKIPADADANNRYLGTTYDTTVYDVTVTVTGDNATGQLTAVAEYTLNGNVTDVAFHNRYTVDPVTDVVITGGKHLSGNIRKLQANAFYFELVENGTVIQTVGNGVPTDDYNASFAFAPITFTNAGTYTYTVREHLPAGVTAANNKLNGVVYDTAVYTVTVEVTDRGDGTLHADVQYPAGGLQFNNAYEVSGTYIDLVGQKTLLGDALTKYTDASAFCYQLYAAHYDPATQTVQPGAYLATATDNGTGVFRFDHQEIAELNFNAIGGYRFIVKEEIPADADPLMDYDASVYYIEVDVTDNLLGSLAATPTVTKVDETGASAVVDGIRFVNELKVESVSVDLGGIKSYNKTLTDGQFTFELYQAMEDAEGKVIAIGDPLLEAANKADGSFKFEEKLLTDELSGTEMMSTHMTFSQPGTYHFVIKEKLPEGVTAENNHKDGISYDTKSYVATVEVTKVTDETGRDVLVYEVIADGIKKGTIQVTNVYDPADATLSLSGKKTLENKAITDGEFTFELYAVDAETKAETLKQSVTNVGEDFAFEELTFDAAGEFLFKVKEKKGENAKITYDTAVYDVVVTVTDENGVLKAAKSVNGTADTVIAFTNIYDADDATLTLSGEKVLDGRDIVDGEFTFELYKVDGEAQTLKESVVNSGNAINFTPLVFNAAGEYKFIIKEKAGTDATITYDTATYEILVTVVNENGVLKANKTVNGAADTAITFTNTYTPPAEPPVEPPAEPPVEPPVEMPPAETANPDTGDHSNLFLWIALLVVSGGLFGAMIFGKKKIFE